MTAKAEKMVMIGGTVKAATTSIFYWLSPHPDVQPATVKETRFFLEPEYPIPRVIETTEDLAAYQNFFPGAAEGKWRLDATPFYLYSKDCAGRIEQALPGTRWIFVLRHPVKRLVSHFHYLKQIGALAREVEFDDYVQSEIEKMPDETVYPPEPIGMGLYSRYLGDFYRVAGNERVLVLFFDDIIENPRAGMGRVCDFLGLENIYDEDYDFTVYNQALGGRLPGVLNHIRNRLVRYTFRSPAIHGMLRSVKHAMERGLRSSSKPTASPTKDLALAPETAQLLNELYGGEADRVGELTGVRPNWKLP